MGAQRTGGEDGGGGGGASFVKVSMDGAPYLRKVDLKLYSSYKDLSHALAKMFSSFTIGNFFFFYFFYCRQLFKTYDKINSIFYPKGKNKIWLEIF